MAELPNSGYRIENILLINSNFFRIDNIDFGKQQLFDHKINIRATSSPVDNEPEKFLVNLILDMSVNFDQIDQYSIQVTMCGVFARFGEPPISLEDFQQINGPAIIYPFVREFVSTVMLKAGIGNVLLPAVNFRTPTAN